MKVTTNGKGLVTKCNRCDAIIFTTNYLMVGSSCMCKRSKK